MAVVTGRSKDGAELNLVCRALLHHSLPFDDDGLVVGALLTNKVVICHLLT